jgi:hypothetical protein
MRIATLVACAALIAVVGVETAEAAPRASDTVTIRGCTRPVVPFCMTVTHRGTTYVLHNANPTIPPRTFVRVKGRVTGTIGICPGSQMQVISWRKARGACTQ